MFSIFPERSRIFVFSSEFSETCVNGLFDIGDVDCVDGCD